MLTTVADGLTAAVTKIMIKIPFLGIGGGCFCNGTGIYSSDQDLSNPHENLAIFALFLCFWR